MDAGPFPSVRHAAHDLSKAEGFALGPLTVDPPSRRVIAGERIEMLEPRVMRVLVALGSARGMVLSRDDLIELCWDGTIVGDNAIKRVIWRLRHALDELSDGAVRLETITKVGFRLVYEQSVAEPAQPVEPVRELAQPPSDAEVPFGMRKMTRRAAAGGIVALGAGSALAYANWYRPLRHSAGPSARELYERGLLMRRSASLENALAAISYFKQAVALDPTLADAWGALAISSSVPMPGAPASAQLARSAARRALAIDPDQPEAQLAMIKLEPVYDRWLGHEERLRSIVRRHPDHPLSNGALGLLLEDVGRFEEAIAYYQHMLDVEPSLPLGWTRLAMAQHYAGREHEADATLDAGFVRFPAHVLLWLARFAVLVGSKRYREAAAFARDPANTPPILPLQFQTFHVSTADALVSRRGIDKKVAELRQAIGFNIQAAQGMVPVLADFGATAAVFDALETYYLGGRFDGRRNPAPDPLAPRRVALLFAPAVFALRDNPRFGNLLKRTGLEDYWRKSGRQPDFRRG